MGRSEHFDVALASLPFEQRIFKKKPFVTFSAVVAVSDKDPLFNKKEINLNDLRKKTWLV